jgi:hypothetical protein
MECGRVVGPDDRDRPVAGEVGAEQRTMDERRARFGPRRATAGSGPDGGWRAVGPSGREADGPGSPGPRPRSIRGAELLPLLAPDAFDPPLFADFRDRVTCLIDTQSQK